MRQKGARGDKLRGGAKRQTRTERNHRLLEELEARIESHGSKASTADYVRLIQLEHELEEDKGAREIKVTWVESSKPENSEE